MNLRKRQERAIRRKTMFAARPGKSVHANARIYDVRLETESERVDRLCREAGVGWHHTAPHPAAKD